MRPEQASPPGDKEPIEFLDPVDDTPENREVASLVEERGSIEDGEDLDQVLRDFGHNPAEFLPK